MIIEEFPKLPKAIKDAINNKKLAIFIGAGVSRFVGCDSWDNLANNLVKKCRDKGFITPFENKALLQESDKIKLISVCDNILKGENNYFMSEMKNSLKYNETDSVNINCDEFQIYRDLKKIGNTFITTNADRFIDKVLATKDIYTKNFNANNIGSNKLYKIHGCISDESSLVFTTEKYIETYSNSDFNNFLESFFAEYSILFVGYGLNEARLLDRILNKPTATVNKFYLKGYFQHEAKIANFDKQYFKQLGIELISFSRDENDYGQLKKVISKWREEVYYSTHKFQNDFNDIDDALKNSSDIITTVNNIKIDKKQARYFFSKTRNYQNLHKWLEPIFYEGLLSLNTSNEFKYHSILVFLETTAIQNKKSEKPETTAILLSIADNTIKKTTDDYVVYLMMKIIFNLPINYISLKHIDFIGRHIKECKHMSALSYGIKRDILPILIENKMQKHILRLLPIIFGYTFQKSTIFNGEMVSIIESYNLQELLKRHSCNIIDLIKIDGVSVIIDIVKNIIKQEKNTFDAIWIASIRGKTPDELSQNRHADRYDNLLIFFIRDLLESLPANKIKPYISDFLLKQKHTIFTRLALHIINHKYDDLKAIFWKWMSAKIEYRNEYEFWILLNESSPYFKNSEFNKVIEWIKSIDCQKDDSNDTEERIAECRAYRRKKWLLCLKDNNKQANKLYQKYNAIYNKEFDHPGFSYWHSGFSNVENSHPILMDKLCENPIQEILNFDPSKIEKNTFETDDDLIEGLANDFSICIQNNAIKFSDNIDDFIKLDDNYKYSLIAGFTKAQQDNKKFNAGKVLDFIYQNNITRGVTEFIESGIYEDKEAFDEKELPKIKKIIFRLIENKTEDSIGSFGVDGIDSLGVYVLNSDNGKALRVLILYALRYGRLNSNKSVKWEEDVKGFFTHQLEANDAYSLLVFTILGWNLHQLYFLDKKWTSDNFNKIFPLTRTKQWVASIQAYFSHSTVVYGDTHRLFKDNGHLKKALDFDFESNNIKSKVIHSVCIAYINDIDNDTIFTLINSKNNDNTLCIITSIWQSYRKITDDAIKGKVKNIWHKIYDAYLGEDSVNTKKIFRDLNQWFVFLDEILDTDMELLIHTIRHVTDDDWPYELIKDMSRLSIKSPNNIGVIYREIIENNIYPCRKQEDIVKILNNLSYEDRLHIINCYNQQGIYTFNNVLDIE